MTSLYQKLPKPLQATLLIVGSEGTGKHTLGRAILSDCVPFTTEIHTASRLPLPAANDATRPKVDFTVLIADLSSRLSITMLEASLKEMPTEYFLGRSCIVCSKVNDAQRSSEFEQVLDIADAYNMPVLCGTIQDEKDCKCLAIRVTQLLKVAAGFTPRVSPLVLSATRLPCKTFRFTQDL